MFLLSITNRDLPIM